VLVDRMDKMRAVALGMQTDFGMECCRDNRRTLIRAERRALQMIGADLVQTGVRIFSLDILLCRRTQSHRTKGECNRENQPEPHHPILMRSSRPGEITVVLLHACCWELQLAYLTVELNGACSHSGPRCRRDIAFYGFG